MYLRAKLCVLVRLVALHFLNASLKAVTSRYLFKIMQFSLKHLSEEKTTGNKSSWRVVQAEQLVVLFVAQDKIVFSLKIRNWHIEFGSTKHSEENPSLHFHILLLFYT